MALKHVYHAVLDSSLAQLGTAVASRLLPEPHIELSCHEIVVPGLPVGLSGLRILHAGDFHWRPGSELARELPELARSVSYDMALYTGDFIDDDAGIEPVSALLAEMPRCDGSFAVLGNHDYRPLGRSHGANDVRRLREMLAASGLHVLANSARALFGGELFVVGVDDPATRRDDIERAMSDVPAGACAIVIAHSPDLLLRIGQQRPGLLLAGHTHGGQVRLPLVGALKTETRLSRRWAMGLYEYSGITTFVTRGIGYSGINVRLRCPAEAALLTLRSPLAAEHVA
jgi:predicted MPP superfamily phosphohydrolase